ncbi:MAG TPA: TetR/AcrR family transcriptional regulator [Solirubrobacterales bacterium]|nr:TetR/AcrR family transcriptional regulator [Solirubrobacterales bacterium]
MGKQAATNVQAGAEGTGRIGEVEALPHIPKLELVNSPKREKILEGMLEAVGGEGYDATSVRTVLARTGLYRQAFYDNFADKDACYLAALEMGIERLEALGMRAAASEESWRGKLRAGLGALLDHLDDEPDFGRGVIVEVHAAGPEALSIRAEAMKRAADFIDLARLEADESESPPQIAPEGIVAGIHAIVHSRLSTGASDGFRGLLPEFMYFAVLPYFGAEAASAEMQAARA